ncbi:hypothetical protein ABES25_19185 [Bacillus gobiensis]|uniref:hypothetical protein n=1 Tax=Bacillus gobiensis TaxID=1441095 RepID=UPI003D1CBEAF
MKQRIVHPGVKLSDKGICMVEMTELAFYPTYSVSVIYRTIIELYPTIIAVYPPFLGVFPSMPH